MSKNGGIYNWYPKIAIIFALMLLIAIFIPFAIPVDRGIDSKEALSFVWIWGLCYGQGEFFFLFMPFGISLFLIFFAILILISSFELNKKKLSLGKFGEQVFIYSFFMLLVAFVLITIIEYNFLFFPNVPLTIGIRADFWTYHNPGYGFYGIFLISYLLLNVSLASMGLDKSNFLGYAIALFTIITFFLVSRILLF